MRVCTNAIYTFRPNGWDRIFTEHHTATDGERVRVIRLPMAPPPNTMGHAHIENADTKEFRGLVSTGSLVKGMSA